MALGGTTSILESALKAGTQLRSVVLMSSAVTVSDEEARSYSEKDWNTEAEAIFERLGKQTDSIIAYTAGKTAAERAFWKFKEEQKPAFSMTAIQGS